MMPSSRLRTVFTVAVTCLTLSATGHSTPPSPSTALAQAAPTKQQTTDSQTRSYIVRLDGPSLWALTSSSEPATHTDGKNRVWV